MSDRPTGSGPGRLLVAVYGILALAATARGIYQVGLKLDEAPVAYLLSLGAGLVYVVATIALATDRRTLAWWAVSIEMLGVLTVGVLKNGLNVMEVHNALQVASIGLLVIVALLIDSVRGGTGRGRA